MTKRRTIEDALTEEEATFLEAAKVTKGEIPTAAIEQNPVSIDAQPSVLAKSQKPENEIQAMGAVLVPLNSRIELQVMTALLRASGERKMKRMRPYTQQDILDEALSDWLRANRYL